MLMKRFTLLLLLCVSALYIQAQSSFHVSKTSDAAQSITHSWLADAPAELAVPKATPFRAAKHPIDEQPEGTLKTYAMNTYYYSQNMDEWVKRYGQKTLIVFDGNDVFIRNIINTNLYNTWIRGEISSDRKKVVFDNYQPYVEQGGYTYYVCLAKVNSNGDVFPDTEADEFTMDYDEATGMMSNESLNLSLVNTDGGVFTFNEGYQLKLFTDELVQLPAEVAEEDIQPYSLRWASKDPYYFPRIVYVAQQGDDFYFKGFSTKTPESWLKGSFNEDKTQVIIPNGQYVGLYDDLYFLYCKGAAYSGMDDDGWPIYSNKDNIVLNYNAEDKSFDGPDGILFVLGKELKGGYSQSIPTQDMDPFYGVPAKPKTPDIRYFNVDDVYNTESNLAFVVPVEDVHGNFISPDALYYRIFLDGEQLHFDNTPGGYYQHFPDEWEVPCAFSDRGLVNNRTDNSNGTMTFHSFSIDKKLRPKTIGLQSIYYMNGTRTLSDICVYDTATKTKTIVEGDPDPTGIKGTVADGLLEGSTTYYDLTGRQIAAPQKGLFIMSVKQANGQTKSIKVLK